MFVNPVVLSNGRLFRICPTCSYMFQRCRISSSNQFFNHYTVLGLKRGASEKEIKRSYLQKCKEYHPDKHFGDKNMQKKFVEVNEAYQVLSDSTKRSEYDARLFGGGRDRSPYSYQNPYQTWRPDGNEYQRGPRSGPQDYWKNAGQKSNSSWNERDFGGRGGTHPYEEFFRQRKQQSESNRNSYHYPYGRRPKSRDPLHNFWEYHYKHRNRGKNENSYGYGSQQRQTYSNPNEQKIIIISFIAILFIIIWVRIATSFRNYKNQQQNEYDYFPEMVASPNHSHTEKAASSIISSNKDHSVDEIIQQLNVKTDEA